MWGHEASLQDNNNNKTIYNASNLVASLQNNNNKSIYNAPNMVQQDNSKPTLMHANTRVACTSAI